MSFLIIFLILLSQQEVFCENEDSVEHLDTTTSPETKQITTTQTDSEAFKDLSTVRTSTIKEYMLETKTTSDKTAADKRTSDDTTSNEMPSDEIISDEITSEEATQRNLDEKDLNYTTSEEPITEEASSVKRSTFNEYMVETRTNSYETTSEQVSVDETTSNKITSDESTSDEITSDETTNNNLDGQEVTKAYTTEGVTKTPDHVKQNILKMFNNLLNPEIINKEETTIDTDESTRTFTTPMTTPSGKNLVTPKSVITTMSGETTSGLLADTIKVSTLSEDVATVKMTILPTIGDTITSTVQSRNIDTKPTTTFITIPTTAQSIINDMETTSNSIKTTTMNREMLSITSTELTMPKATLTQNTNMDIIMTTSEVPYMRTTEEVKSNTKERAVELSTIISEEEDSSNTTSEDTKEEQTTAKETPEEVTTNWFYPTTKPVTAAFYRTIQEVPFKNKENLDQNMLSKRKKALTRIPWIFPQWVSGQKLDPFQNPYPRRIQL